MHTKRNIAILATALLLGTSSCITMKHAQNIALYEQAKVNSEHTTNYIRLDSLFKQGDYEGAKLEVELQILYQLTKTEEEYLNEDYTAMGKTGRKSARLIMNSDDKCLKDYLKKQIEYKKAERIQPE